MQIGELKAKLSSGEQRLSFSSAKKKPVISEAETKAAPPSSSEKDPPALFYKDGSSDSDSSAVLNDENIPRRGNPSSMDEARPLPQTISAPLFLDPDHLSGAIKEEGFLHHQLHHMLMMEAEEEPQSTPTSVQRRKSQLAITPSNSGDNSLFPITEKETLRP
ncbi:hypothetical protein BHE74_00012705 [Ensete ventricosum]|nr:hypothetical protein BHE74_00012705 [Ensete ventricosum]